MDLRQLKDYEDRKAEEERQGAEEETVVGDWAILRVLGKGSFGRVVLAQRRSTGELAAIKLLPRGPLVQRYATYVAREIVHQASLRHPFVVLLKETLLTEKSLAIAMEYCSGGNLFHYVKSKGQLSEGEARWIFQQLVLGLAYCHDRGVANRDLKLENLLLERRPSPVPGAEADDGSDWPLLKICDFGYSKHEMNSTAKTSVGTPLYMAPEVIGGSNKYSAKKADVWSCGVILYILLFGVYPFNPESKKDCAMAIVMGQWTVPAGTSVSLEGQHLLHKMMTVDPLLRIDIPGILTHPWFQMALPDGAASMNNLYLANAPNLEPLVPRIQGMVQAAEEAGPPGQVTQIVTF